MTKYTCNSERATASNYPKPGLCHVQCMGTDSNEFEKWLEVGFAILDSSEKSNCGKTTSTKLFQEFKGKPSPSFDRALMNITVALGIRPREYFDECCRQHINPEIDVDAWRGRQCVIVLEPQKDKPQYTRVAAYYTLDAHEVEGCPLNNDVRKLIDDCLARGEQPPVIGDDDDEL